MLNKNGQRELAYVVVIDGIGTGIANLRSSIHGINVSP